MVSRYLNVRPVDMLGFIAAGRVNVAVTLYDICPRSN